MLVQCGCYIQIKLSPSHVLWKIQYPHVFPTTVSPGILWINIRNSVPIFSFIAALFSLPYTSPNIRTLPLIIEKYHSKRQLYLTDLLTIWESEHGVVWVSLKLNIRHDRSYDFHGGSDSKESACNAGDLSSIPGLGRSSGEGNGNPLQYSCLENSTEEPGRLKSMGSQRVGHDWATNTFTFILDSRSSSAISISLNLNLASFQLSSCPLPQLCCWPYTLRRPSSVSQLFQLLAVEPASGHLTFFCLTFLIY